MRRRKRGGFARNRRHSPPIDAFLGTSAQNGGDMRGWFKLILHPTVTPRPAGLQGIPEKAADRIRTDDLLHGNYARFGRLSCDNQSICRGLLGGWICARRRDANGCAPICGVSGTSRQKFPKSAGAVPVDARLSRHCPHNGAIYASASMAAMKSRTAPAASSTSATGNCISPASAR